MPPYRFSLAIVKRSPETFYNLMMTAPELEPWRWPLSIANFVSTGAWTPIEASAYQMSMDDQPGAWLLIAPEAFEAVFDTISQL